MTPDITTDYLGLTLRSPIVASAGPLTSRTDSLRALEDAGIAAVVLPSLFEEQIVHDQVSLLYLAGLGGGSSPEATSYFPDLGDMETVTERYLRHLENAKAAVDVPVIASLNGVTPGGWSRYATLLESAGADAIELNLYVVAADPDVPGSEIEDDEVALVASIVDTVSVPVAVKIGPYYSSVAHMATRLQAAGARGLVMFNRFYQPELSIDTRRVAPALELSTSSDLRLPLRWIGLLHGRVGVSLAASSGVHSGADVVRAVLAGADIAMTTSAVLRHGPGHVATMEHELVAWLTENEITSLATVRGSASQRHVGDPAAFERANYLHGLVDFAAGFRAAGPP